MDYKIGDVSALFGLSTETLRNYERAGLIQSKRDVSYFRCYDMDTVRKLVGLRVLRNEGFSIQELQEIYHNISIEEYHDLMKEKLELQEKKVVYETLVLERMRQVEQRFAEVQERPGRIYEIDSPDFYILSYEVDSFIDMKGLAFEQLSSWTRNLFLVQYMHSFPKEIMEGPRKNMQEDTREDTVSMAVDRVIAEKLGLDLSPPVAFWPSRHCVCCSLLKNAQQDAFDCIRQPMGEYLKERGLTVADRPFYLSNFTFHQEEEILSCMDIYVPVA